MYRTFIATITAASIALTALGSTSAFAGERQNTQALITILGIAAAGAIIHKRNKDKKKQAGHHLQPKPHHQHKPDVYQPQLPTPVYEPPRYHQPKPRPLPQRANRKLLPQECFRSFETRRGQVRMFGARCLQRNYKFVNRLPQSCEYIFNTKRGDRRGYEARCLRKNGFRLARG